MGAYLQRSRHGTIYYFRRKVPLDLRQQLRAPQFELSLGHHTFENRAITATERAIAPYKLLATVGSWGDTLTYAEVLDHLKIWNETGDIKLDPIPPPH